MLAGKELDHIHLPCVRQLEAIAAASCTEPFKLLLRTERQATGY